MKTIFSISLCLCLYIVGQAQISKTVNVITPGTLGTLLTAEDKATVTSLSITGTIDARDFRSLTYPMLTVLDMSAASIQGYNGIEGTNLSIDSYPANELPAFSFSDGAKSKTTIKSITLPNSITSIGTNAFVNCSSLTDISFPSSLITIGIKAFTGCSSLTHITLGNSIDSIGNNSFQNCTSLNNISLGNSVTSIGGWAFDGCNGLTSFSMPNSVTAIGSAAFQSCNALTNISFSNSLISIGEYAFNGCTGLTNITIPNSVTSIGNSCFYYCTSLKSFTVGNSLASIGSLFFNCTSLAEFIVQPENSYFSSKDGVIFNKDQTVLVLYPQGKQGEYIIPNTVNSTISSAFKYCNGLTKVTIPDSFTSIGNYTFQGLKGLTNISISNSVTSIGNYAFDGCKVLTDLIIPSSVMSIGEFAFSGCIGLTSLSIPNSVKSIGNLAFMSCNGLKLIYIYSVNPTDISCTAYIFAYINKDNCTLYVPKGSLTLYQATIPWSDFKNIVEMTTGLQPISESDIRLFTENEKLVLSNVKFGNKVQIFTVSGVKVKEQEIESTQTKILLNSGIYIVRIGKYSGKVIIN